MPAAAARGRCQLLGEVGPRAPSTVAGVSRLSSDDGARFLSALGREQQRGSGPDYGTDQETGPEKSNVLPIDGPTERGPARSLGRRERLLAVERTPATHIGVGLGTLSGLVPRASGPAKVRISEGHGRTLVCDW